MYEFVTGPLVWLSFAIFFVGLILRAVFYIRGLDWRLDRVTYSVNTSYGVRGAVRSILFWLYFTWRCSMTTSSSPCTRAPTPGI